MVTRRSTTKRSAATARETAVRLLARRAHGRPELEAKLRARGFDGTEVAAVLDALTDNGTLRASDYAEAVCLDARRRGKGRRWAESKLRLARIPDAVARSTLDEFMATGDEDERLSALLRARGWTERLRGELDQRERAKVVRLLVTRGFAPAAIRAALGRAAEGLDDEQMTTGDDGAGAAPLEE